MVAKDTVINVPDKNGGGKLIRFIFLMMMLAGMLLGAGCGSEEPVAPVAGHTLTLYSELDNKFTQDVVDAFNKEQKNKLQVKVIYELKQGGEQPDLVLAEQRTLSGFKRQGRLKALAFAAGDRLAPKFRDEDLEWYGVFYDPTVFLINQQYARGIGQANLTSWADLEGNENIRIAIENLSDSNSTQNFLAAFAEHFGETTSLNYLWNINRFIGQYAKFPFTPVRMTAVGDADLAITRQSYVFKYLESKFPAYVVQPAEGSPVNLYCVGVFEDCTQDELALDFMEWLLVNEKVQTISQEDATGFMFLFPRGLEAPAAAAEKIWLNSSYLEPEKQEELTNKWLGKVRFSK